MKSTTKISGKRSGGMSMTDMKSGMSNHSPKRPDASMVCKGPSVNADADRSGVAPTPRSLGGRSA
jgi:hypothetical protein